MIIAPLLRLSSAAVSGPFVVATIVAGALVATRLARIVTRVVIRHLARRSILAMGPSRERDGMWRTRQRRVGDELVELVEQRRRQRMDAATRMISHLVAIVIWIVASIVTFHVLDVDPAFFLSSAGFIGAGLAIGGQHKVNDYLTGLSVHMEDRYGVGDEIMADVGWSEPMRGVVDHVGLFSTRVRDRTSTMHFPNHALTSVRNLSQEASASTLHVNVPGDVDPERAAAALRDLAGSDGLTQVVFVGDLEARSTGDGRTEIDVTTSRTLDERARERLVERAERALSSSR